MILSVDCYKEPQRTLKMVDNWGKNLCKQNENFFRKKSVKKFKKSKIAVNSIHEAKQKTARIIKSNCNKTIPVLHNSFPWVLTMVNMRRKLRFFLFLLKIYSILVDGISYYLRSAFISALPIGIIANCHPLAKWCHHKNWCCMVNLVMDGVKIQESRQGLIWSGQTMKAPQRLMGIEGKKRNDFGWFQARHEYSRMPN